MTVSETGDRPVGWIERFSSLVYRVYRQPVMILASGVICLLLGIVLHLAEFHFTSTSNKWLPYCYTFLREFGFALIISYFITMGIERTSRDRHNDHVSQQIELIKTNVFEAVYSRRQDPRLISLLETEIFGRPFFRTGYEVQMTFAYIASDIEAQMLKVTIQLRYRQNNTTNKSQSSQFKATIEIPYNKRLADEAQIKSLAINGVALTPQELEEANVRLPDTLDFKRYEWPLEVPARGHVDVRAEYSLVKHCRDAMVWQVFDPCDGLSVTVFHPEDIIIFGAPIHSSEGEKHGGGLHENTFAVRINEPLFPHNGVQMWWSPAREFEINQQTQKDTNVAT